MADKRMITTVIDSIEERLPDSKSGWGKYKAYLEGEKGIFQLDVPGDLNKEFDLQEGYVVTIVEGPYKGWIVHSNSECFTGEPFPEPQQQQQQQPERRGGSNRSSSGSGSGSTKGRDKSNSPKPTKVATPKSGNTHTAWNQYQIDVRDPQMRMQTILSITKDIHCACIEQGCDPNDVINAIVEDAKNLDSVISEYLGI